MSVDCADSRGKGDSSLYANMSSVLQDGALCVSREALRSGYMRALAKSDASIVVYHPICCRPFQPPDNAVRYQAHKVYIGHAHAPCLLSYHSYSERHRVGATLRSVLHGYMIPIVYNKVRYRRGPGLVNIFVFLEPDSSKSESRFDSRCAWAPSSLVRDSA